MLWPEHEAQTVLNKVRGKRDRPVTLEPITLMAGFGPSGPPHLGHLSEILRTHWIREAIEENSSKPFEVELIVFSDDMDGLRDVPENIPRRDDISGHLGEPLFRIPDPYGEKESYARQMEDQLLDLLDTYNIDCTFIRASEAHIPDQTESFTFDDYKPFIEHLDDIEDRIHESIDRTDWQPFLPICGNCQSINETEVVKRTRFQSQKAEDLRCLYQCERCGTKGERSIRGSMKMKWKLEWPLRWHAFDVDYEMYGKDLNSSFRIGSDIMSIIGEDAPIGYQYEMFLDEDGQKISSSDGQSRAISVDEWTEYAPLDSLRWFLMKNPNKARKIGPEQLRHSVENWLSDLREIGYDPLDEENPIQYSYQAYRYRASEISYGNLINLASALDCDDPETLWQMVVRDEPEDVIAADRMLLRHLTEGAVNFYQTFLREDKHSQGTEEPPEGLGLDSFLDQLDDGQDEEEYQTLAYQTAKDSEFQTGEWFSWMYRLILGQDHGPRLGRLIELLGVDRVRTIINHERKEDNHANA